MRRGIAFLEEAIARDGQLAPAWAELASALSLAPAFGDSAPSEVLTRAREAAQRAIALDGTLGQAHVALGIINTFYDGAWDEALSHFSAATRLNPGDANAKLFRTWALVCKGELDSALAAVREAGQLDPFAPIINTRVSTVLYYMRRYDESAAEARKALELDPTNLLARFQLGHTLTAQGKYAEAYAVYPADEGSRSGWDEGRLGNALGRGGKRAEAQAILRRLQERRRRTYVTPEAIAAVSAGLRDTSRALDWLEQAVREHGFYVVFVAAEPVWDELHGLPRFQALLKATHVQAPRR
ncbi:MAG: tetratricopeptide repeat protein [Gemmatimonadetes bacterium]|nr:tetratricopeptide repeat protein [Gemmatimonadota bacterium]